MSQDAIESRVKEIVADQLGLSVEEVQTGSLFTGDLGADDLDFLEIIMAFEEEFEVDIDDSVAERFVSIQDVIDFVSQRAN